MAVEVAGTIFHWSQQPSFPGSSSLSVKTLAFTFSIAHQSCSLGTAVIHRSHQRRREGNRGSSARASFSARFDGFGFMDHGKDREDEYPPDFEMEIDRSRMNREIETSDSGGESTPSSSSSSSSPVSDTSCPSLFYITPEARLNSVDLPLSLRILTQKKTKQWESVEMAFSSMVFIVRELQIHAIRMREALFSSSKIQIQGILSRVHDELHASFVWLFQRIFSATPTLMISLMLLLANFTIFSIADYPAYAKPPIQSISSSIEESGNLNSRFDSSAAKSLSIGRSAAVGGIGGGGGGKQAPAVPGEAGDGHWDQSSSSFRNGGTISSDDYEKAWKGIVEEAERIRASGRHEVLMDSDTLRRFVSPVTAELEPDDLSAYAVTELSYRRALAGGLDDPLILANFAQFLFVVLHDHGRAEEYFKRAAMAEPADPEALSRYANFLWLARKDLGAAEETFLEAIEADPGNSYHSANYAHFLWSTGGEDTCYPPDDCDS